MADSSYGNEMSNQGSKAQEYTLGAVRNEVDGRVTGPMVQANAISGGVDSVHLHAQARGEAEIYQAGRDQYIEQHHHYQNGVARVTRTGTSSAVADCPYPGLASFGREQARWFFGRNQLTAELTAHLDTRLRVGGMQMVVAPSGAGKSSLLHAGLLSKLDSDVLPGSSQWPKIVFTPTAHPYKILAHRIASLVNADPTTVASGLEKDPGWGVALLRDVLRRRDGEDPGARVVVVVDQFEEVFTLCTNKQQRSTFIELLSCAATTANTDAGGQPVGLVVVGVRADFYADCTNYPSLRLALQDNPLVVGPMSGTELREAILYPAQDVGLDVEPGLVELLLSELADIITSAGDNGIPSYEAGRLPLLAHALRATWQQRHGRTLTVEGYRVAGGIYDAVATTAERVFNQLDSAGQRVARALFLRLVKIGDDADDSRRTLVRKDLLQGSPDPDTVSAVLNAFTRSRLLTQEQDTVEITHEALLRAWPRLRNWIDEDRAGNLAHQELEEAASAWDRGQRDSAVLLRGSRLETARTWFDTSAHVGDLSSVARAYFTASVRQDTRIRHRRRNVVILLCVLALVASAAAGLAFQQREKAQAESAKAQTERAKAQAERDDAILRQLSTKADQLRATDPALAAKLALVAYRQLRISDIYRDAPDLYMSLVAGTRTSLNDPDISLNPSSEAIEGNVNSMTYSPDGRTLAVGVRDGRVRLWDVTDPAHPTPLALLTDRTKCPSDQGATDSCVASMAYSPDGRTLAVGAAGKIRLWDVTDPTHATSLPQLTDRTKCLTFDVPGEPDECVFSPVAYSPDGRILVAARGDNRILLWNVTDPMSRPTELPGDLGTLMSMAFSPDGRTLATGSAGKILLWNVTDPSHPAVLGELTIPGQGYVPSVAFSPDGRTLAGGDVLKLWNIIDLAHPTPLAELVGHPQGTMVVAFSPNQHILASKGYGDGIRLWNITDSTHPAPMGAFSSSEFLDVVEFSPNGRTLATVGHTIGLWEMDVDHAIRTICARHGNLTREEWQQYISGLPYSPACV